MQSLTRGPRRLVWILRRELLHAGSGTRRKLLFAVWPFVEPLVCLLDRSLPARLRNSYRRLVFHRVWDSSWGRAAYEPVFRDKLFRYIMTFQYEYPISPGDTVVQVGASFGEETARFARAVGAQGRVIAIEPEVGNLERLRASFSDVPQVTVVDRGVSDRAGEMTLLVGGEREHRLSGFTPARLSYTWWGVRDELNEERYKGKAVVRVETLDDIIGRLSVGEVDFLLVETNGNELEVIKGLDHALPSVRRIAARGHVMRDGAPVWRDIETHLHLKGYRTRTTDEGMVLAAR